MTHLPHTYTRETLLNTGKEGDSDTSTTHLYLGNTVKEGEGDSDTSTTHLYSGNTVKHW